MSKQPDIRKTEVFWSEFSGALWMAARRYVFAPEIPTPDPALTAWFPGIVSGDLDQFGAFIDMHFRDPAVLPDNAEFYQEYTHASWDLYSKARMRGVARVSEPNITGVGVRLPNNAVLFMEIPSFYPSHYATKPHGANFGAQYFPGAIQHERVLRDGISKPARDYIDDLTAWSNALLLAHQKASDAIGFLSTLSRCCTHTTVFLNALPGLLGIAQHFVPGYCNVVATSKPLSGRCTFNTAAMSRYIPTWALDWATHRGTLTAMSVATNNHPRFLDTILTIRDE